LGGYEAKIAVEIPILNGTEAQLAWEKMIVLETGELKEQLTRDLKEYCELDTSAMVRIHEVLQ
jgi:hypothetical protein